MQLCCLNKKMAFFRTQAHLGRARLLGPAVALLLPGVTLVSSFASSAWASTSRSPRTQMKKAAAQTAYHRFASRFQPARALGVSEHFSMLGGGSGGGALISPSQALKGRKQKMAGIAGLKHYVLGNDLEEVPEGFKVAVFANGCFWGSEKGAWRLPAGIHSTAVGYCGGFTPNPTYEEVCSGRTGHTEGVRVVYDPAQISFADILRLFWESHDPTSGMGQGNDLGTQYRSGLYYFDDEQRQLIEASKRAFEAQLGRPITTEVASAAAYGAYGGVWFFAEPEHQQYLAKPRSRPYCSARPTGVSLSPFAGWAPAGLEEAHGPTLPEAFWRAHGPRPGCSVVEEPNEPIAPGSF